MSTFLFLSPLAFAESGGAHTPTQMARALARRGHAVWFVEPQGAARTDVDGVRVVSLESLGMTAEQVRRAWYGLPADGLDAVVTHLKEMLAQSLPPRVAVWSASFAPYVRLLPVMRALDCVTVYDAMDDFAAAPALGYTQFAAPAEEYLTRHADVRIGVTDAITTSLTRFGGAAQTLGNGIDLMAWGDLTGLLRDQSRLPSISLGFWGTLMDSMFDADLVAQVAEARPAWQFHLLGAVDPEPHRPSVAARLGHLPNVTLHGAVAHDELPRYAASFDVCIAPLPDNAFTRGRDPLKVYEYLACYKPVVVSHAPQLSNMPCTTVVNSAQEFVAAVERAAATPIDPEVINSFLAQHTWVARADAFLQLIADVEPQASGDGALAPELAQPDRAAWARYVDALEQELAQVTTWTIELERQAQRRRGVRRWLPVR